MRYNAYRGICGAFIGGVAPNRADIRAVSKRSGFLYGKAHSSGPRLAPSEDGRTLLSYGHWPMAWRMPDGMILVNIESSTVTTNRHRNLLCSVLRDRGTPYCPLPGKVAHRLNLESARSVEVPDYVERADVLLRVEDVTYLCGIDHDSNRSVYALWKLHETALREIGPAWDLLFPPPHLRWADWYFVPVESKAVRGLKDEPLTLGEYPNSLYGSHSRKTSNDVFVKGTVRHEILGRSPVLRGWHRAVRCHARAVWFLEGAL